MKFFPKWSETFFEFGKFSKFKESKYLIKVRLLSIDCPVGWVVHLDFLQEAEPGIIFIQRM